jgi:hypothetical protein
MSSTAIEEATEAARISVVVLTLRPIGNAPLFSGAFSMIRLAVGGTLVDVRRFSCGFSSFVSLYSYAHEILDLT